jgi:hypothetical protein
MVRRTTAPRSSLLTHNPEVPLALIDPVQYGRLLASVESLEAQVEAMERNVVTLLELANKSKGGLWAGMALASIFGGLFSWLFAQLASPGSRA